MSASVPTISTIPSPTSSSADFDFLLGRWTIHNRKLKTRLAQSKEWFEFGAIGEMRRILNGLGNTDTFSTTVGHEPFEGIALRLFNPQTRLWSIHWADSIRGSLDASIVGSFQDSIGLFYGNDTHEGQSVVIKFEWDKTDSTHPVWRQAFSADEGQTWEWNWYMYFSRPE